MSEGARPAPGPTFIRAGQALGRHPLPFPPEVASLEEAEDGLAALRAALKGRDERAVLGCLALALRAGAPAASVERAILRVMAEDGEELHSLLFTSAAFDIAAGLGPEAGKYPLAAAALQVTRQPKDSRVRDLVARARERASAATSASMGEAERALAEALDRGDVARAVDASIELHRLSGESTFVVNLFAKWSARPEVILKPAGYVTHLPLQVAAALNLLQYVSGEQEADLLLGHLAFAQVELSRRYRTRRVEPRKVGEESPSEALAAFKGAVQSGDLGALGPLIARASKGPQGLEETGRALQRLALEEEGGLGHRFVLADAARRLARQLHPAVGRAVLHNAALSIANGYKGPKKLLDVRDLPHPQPGGRDYAGRLLVGLTSGNLAEAHAGLRGLFESGTSARQAALAFLDASAQTDTAHLTSDHPFILTQAAWRAIADGSFAGEAVPLLAELAAKLALAPKGFELIQAVEEAWSGEAQAPA